jgi:hypothetical protein
MFALKFNMKSFLKMRIAVSGIKFDFKKIYLGIVNLIALFHFGCPHSRSLMTHCFIYVQFEPYLSAMADQFFDVLLQTMEYRPASILHDVGINYDIVPINETASLFLEVKQMEVTRNKTQPRQ